MFERFANYKVKREGRWEKSFHGIYFPKGYTQLIFLFIFHLKEWRIYAVSPVSGTALSCVLCFELKDNCLSEMPECIRESRTRDPFSGSTKWLGGKSLNTRISSGKAMGLILTSKGVTGTLPFFPFYPYIPLSPKPFSPSLN